MLRRNYVIADFIKLAKNCRFHELNKAVDEFLKPAISLQ